MARAGEINIPFRNCVPVKNLLLMIPTNCELVEVKMSHSKHTKRGYSLYIEKWNSSAKKYINNCCICGHRGYNPVIERDDFCTTPENKVIYEELTKTLCKKLELDESGRCKDCARVQEYCSK